MEKIKDAISIKINSGDKAFISLYKSISKDDYFNRDKTYECIVVEIITDKRYKLTMPYEYGEEVILPLDAYYFITFETEETSYFGKASIIKRFEDINGKCFIIELVEELSKKEKESFISFDTSIEAKYSLQDSKTTYTATINRLSLREISMICSEYVEEKAELDIVFVLNDKHEILIAGKTIETLRNRQGLYEAYIKIEQIDINSQHIIARWILDNL